MAKKEKRVHLSRGEMEIMALLWNEGPQTLAQAHQAFSNYGRPIGYPTMQTRLNRLALKGFVSRSDERPASYSAKVTRDQVGQGHVSQLLEKVGRGVIVPLVAHLIKEGTLSPPELAELKRLLSEAEKSHSQRKRRE